MSLQDRTVTTTEPAKTPPESVFFAYIAMLPLVVGAVALWFVPTTQSFLLLNLVLLWAASIIIFLSGVRRGVSFRTPQGPHVSQLVMMLWLFVVGFASVLATVWGFPVTAIILEIVAYVSIAIIDPISARNGDAPLFFAKLRPVQMVLPIAALVVAGAFVWSSPIF